MDDSLGFVLGLAIMGLIGGIVLFARGLVAYRRDRLISAVATSSLDGLAAGEVRVSGLVQAIDQLLISPLQSRPCVWYRARIESTDDDRRVLLDEERAVHFRITDGRGQIRVVPGGARWEIGAAFDESTSLTGDEPPGLDRRRGAGYGMVVPEDPDAMTEAQRQAAIEALLTVSRRRRRWTRAGARRRGSLLEAPWRRAADGVTERLALEVGETVTIIGQALPWSDVRSGNWKRTSQRWQRRPGHRRRHRGRTRGRRAGGKPRGGLGQRGHPGLRHRSADAPAGARPGRPAAAGPGRAPTRRPWSATTSRTTSSSLARAPGGYARHLPRLTPQAATQQHDLAFLLGLVGAVMAVCCALALGAVLTGSL